MNFTHHFLLLMASTDISSLPYNTYEEQSYVLSLSYALAYLRGESVPNAIIIDCCDYIRVEF